MEWSFHKCQQNYTKVHKTISKCHSIFVTRTLKFAATRRRKRKQQRRENGRWRWKEAERIRDARVLMYVCVCIWAHNTQVTYTPKRKKKLFDFDPTNIHLNIQLVYLIRLLLFISFGVVEVCVCIWGWNYLVEVFAFTHITQKWRNEKKVNTQYVLEPLCIVHCFGHFEIESNRTEWTDERMDGQWIERKCGKTNFLCFVESIFISSHTNETTQVTPYESSA